MTRWVIWLAVLGATGLAAAPSSGWSQDRTPGRYLSVQLADADAARSSADLRPLGRTRITVTLRDPTTGSPLGGVGVGAWIVPDDGRSCADWYAQVGRAARTDDEVTALIGFDIAEAIADSRIALVDPQFDLASANIKAITQLTETLQGWAVGQAGHDIAAVTAGTQNAYLVDPAAGRAARVALPTAAHGVTASRDGYWFGLADGRASLIGTDGKVVRTVAVGRGPVAVLGDSQSEAVALAGDGQGLVLKPGRAQRITLNEQPGSAVLSPLADSLFALSRAGDALLRADLDGSTAESDRFPLEFVAARITSAPTGRWIALADHEGQRIGIFDTRTMRVRWRIDMPDPVVEMAFSDNFLYLMHRRQGGVTRVTFDPEGGPPGLSGIAAGLPSDVPQEAGPLPRLIRIPGGGMLVASSRERQAYIVAESGAQAAVTVVPLRAGKPLGLAVRQRGLVPGASAGTYESYFTSGKEGRYLAVIRTDAPELLQCQGFAVGRLRAARLSERTKPLVAPDPVRLQLDFSTDGLRVQLPAGTRLQRAMLMRQDGSWRQFFDAVPDRPGAWMLRESQRLAPGSYQVFIAIDGPEGEETLTETLTVADNGERA